MAKLSKILVISALSIITMSTTAFAQMPKDTDSGLLMLVNAKYRIPDGFDPDKVMFEDTYYLMREEAAENIEIMLDDMENELGEAPMVVSTYRTYQKQVDLFNTDYNGKLAQGLSPEEAMKQTRRYVALPGASEHHTALAIDLSNDGTLEEDFIDTEAGKWIKKNCYKYGFVVRYPKTKEEITGIGYEPWHIRYVGRPHSDIMYANNWCLEEYIAVLENNGMVTWADGETIWQIYYTENENAVYSNVVDISNSNTGGYVVTTHKGKEIITKAETGNSVADRRNKLLSRLNG